MTDAMCMLFLIISETIGKANGSKPIRFEAVQAQCGTNIFFLARQSVAEISKEFLPLDLISCVPQPPSPRLALGGSWIYEGPY